MRITFEGEHRSGKGTQIDIYKKRHDAEITVVRGDGSYQGGLEEVLSEEEIAFRRNLNERLYKETDKVDVLWGIAATACAMTINKPQFKDTSLLIDRGPLSRASFLLSRGMEGDELVHAMYPGFSYSFETSTINQEPIPLEDVDFGKIVYIKVPTPVLLSRISPDDPKAEFRKRNIIEKEGLFDRAIKNLPRDIQNSIEVVDGNQSPDAVLDSYDI